MMKVDAECSISSPRPRPRRTSTRTSCRRPAARVGRGVRRGAFECVARDDDGDGDGEWTSGRGRWEGRGASVSTPVDAVAVRARVNAMTTRAGPSASATRHLEAFDDALEEDASNFKARGRVGSTRYEALREWVTRDVEGYDEMRDEHKAMDAVEKGVERVSGEAQRSRVESRV